MVTESAYIHSPVGLLQLVQSGEFISAIHFVDDATDQVTDHFYTALLRNCATELYHYFDGKLRQFSFPFLQEGTDFQQRVWTQLSTIPYGRTVSYMHMAIQLGDPKCIRAAGTANGKNKLAIVVPCHRVIGNNGSLTGYAGGLHRKKWLLSHEAKIAHGLQPLFD